ncbi:MAG TPA: hypothetical protein VHN79_03405 [Lacunisphaera sp.]|nr:hypothetical protein [Lacunisphaera sp.]
MPYLRQQPKIPANGRVTLRLTPAQRDGLLAERDLPRGLGHVLHRAPVKQGKLQVRVTRTELDALIIAATRLPVPHKAAERALNVFLSYLETQEERFTEPPENSATT